MRIATMSFPGRTLRFGTAGLLGAFLAAAAAAAPDLGGGTTTQGVVIDQTGSTTTITAPDNSIIDWQGGFNVGASETVIFNQPDAAARHLSRDVSGNVSEIAGRIEANGIIYLQNQAGILFVNGSVIDVGGIFASGGAISDNDFLTNLQTDTFTDITGEVTNNGSIVARDFVHLIGQRVINAGSITANGGVITMLAGNNAVLMREESGRVTVQLDQDALNPADPGAAPASSFGVDNSGTVRADNGGQVIMGAGDLFALAVRQRGMVSATDGEVNLQSDGSFVDVTPAGVVDATGGVVTIDAAAQAELRGEVSGRDITVTAGNGVVLDATVTAAEQFSADAGAGVIDLSADVVGDAVQTYLSRVLVSGDRTLTGQRVVFEDVVGRGTVTTVAAGGSPVNVPVEVSELTINGEAEFMDLVGLVQFDSQGPVRDADGVLVVDAAQSPDLVTVNGDAIVGSPDLTNAMNIIAVNGVTVTGTTRLNSPFTFLVSDVTRLEGGIDATPADGTTLAPALQVDANLELGGQAGTADNPLGSLAVGRTTTILDQAAVISQGNINLNGDVNGADADLTLTAQQGLVVFSGHVGNTDPLANLTVNVEDPNGLILFDRDDLATVSVLENILLNPSGRSGVPRTATILAINGALELSAETGSVRVGQHEKLSVLGDLTVAAGDTVTLGDVSTLGAFTVTAPRVQALTRRGSLLVVNILDGDAAPDSGVDWVAGGAIDLGGVPVENLGAFDPVRTAADQDLAEEDFFLVGNPVSTLPMLDLGLAVELPLNLAEAFAAEAALPEATSAVSDPLLPGPGLIGDLAQIGLVLDPLTAEAALSRARGRVLVNDLGEGTLVGDPTPGRITVYRVPRASAERLLQGFRAASPVDLQGASSDLRAQTVALRRSLADAWEAFAVESDGRPSAEGFPAFLEARAEYQPVLESLHQLRATMRVLDSMGLAQPEADRVRRGILSAITPGNMHPMQLETILRRGDAPEVPEAVRREIEALYADRLSRR